MGLLRATAATLALLGSALAAPASEIVGRAATAKVCDDASKICYTENVSAAGVSYRVAIPDSAAAGKPFDILVSITAPKAIGWAAIAWGGQMANNPLTIAWSSAATALASSRKATGHTAPAAYPGATLTILPSSVTNTTHWRLDALCTGCSSWDQGGKTVSLDPAGTANFAGASSASAPAEPTNKDSRITIHNAKAKWAHDLAGAKNANFDALVKAKFVKA